MGQLASRLGEFEIVRELGRGGMGVVYEAVQTSLGRRVALKVLGPGLGLTPRAVDRFRREAAAAAKLHHTNIVPVYATGEQDGTHFYAMELIDGPSLDAVIRRMRDGQGAVPRAELPADLAATGPHQPADPAPSPIGSGNSTTSSADRFDRAAAMIADVADALHHAHQNGVTHRDVKPANLLLSADGRLSVTDFGLARMLEQPGMTVTGEFVGTPAYMSPEQITAGRVPVDHRTDIYSLGATLYELLTLRPPFAADGRDKLLAMVLQKEPAAPRSLDPRVPRDLETVCLKALDKDPDRRYQSARDLADDLRRFVNRFAVLARRAGPLTRARKWVRRNPALSAAGLAVLIALATAGLFAWQSHQTERRRLADERKREEEAVVERRQTALERAIVAAMTGQFADADAALLEAERFGADLAQRRFVAGILAHYRGRSDEAKRLLLEACGERPDWVAPRAFLSVVCNYLNDWEGQDDHGNAAYKLTPVTADDYLFRGYMVGLPNPRRGLPDVEKAWGMRRSVLAQFVRAEVLLNLADHTGRVEDAVAARDAMRGARTFLGDAPSAAVTSLFIYCVGCRNCRLHGRADEARRWLADGEADFRAAGEGACRTLPNSLRSRSEYLRLRDGNADALAEENRQEGLKGIETAACQVYLAHLFRRNRIHEALAYIDKLPREGSQMLSFSRAAFLLSRDTEAARAECRRALAEDERASSRGWLYVPFCLVGLPDEARRQAKVAGDRSLGGRDWDDLGSFARRLMAHAFEGAPMDGEAEAGESRIKRGWFYGTMGWAELSRGNREASCRWFRLAQKAGGVGQSDVLSEAVVERILRDPTWPPWLAEKK